MIARPDDHIAGFSNGVLAIKAVAHKLCRACYHILKDQVPFDIAKAFA